MSGRWDDYVATWRRRLAAERASRRQDLDRAKRDARKMARILAREFGARRVWLFGSVATGDVFHTQSDIDLAVEGVDDDRWTEVERRLEEVSRFAFDLVAIEQASPTLRERVFREGVILHDGSPRTL